MHGVILVTRATGDVGRQFVLQLLGTGAAVRASTSNPESAGRRGNVVRGDLYLPGTLDA